MTAVLKTLVAGAVAATTFAAIPAFAMPVAVTSSQDAIVKVSGWATRAAGHRDTYPQPYGYGTTERYGRGAYGSWGYGANPGAYGDYGRALPPSYGYDEFDGSY